MAGFNGNQMSSLPASFTQLMTLAGRGAATVSDCRGGGGGLFTSADDNRLAKVVEEKHSPDGRCVDIGRLLLLIQDIFTRATQTVKLGDEAKARGSGLTLEAQLGSTISIGSGISPKPTNSSPDLALTIERVSCEMGCKCLTDDTVDGHIATLAVLGHVSHYPWEAKLVLTQAAFAVNYGEFLLLSQVYSTSPLAQSMAQIKQLPSILKNEALVRQLEAIGGLIKAMLDVTKVVVQIAGSYGGAEDAVVKDLVSLFPMTVYYVIRSVVAAAAHISLISTTATDEYMPTTTELELNNWTNKLNLILAYLLKMKETADQTMVEKKEEEDYKKLWTIVIESSYEDNMTVIGNLIYPKTDLLPLFDGDTKKKVELGVLYGKTVLLLISELDMDPDQLTKLIKIYNQHQNNYAIVWVPMVDPTTATCSPDPRFNELQSMMPWYSVSQPSIVSKAAIRLIIQAFNFKVKPILVSLDPRGKITSVNALHMMWIWQNDAFPFSLDREQALWKQQHDELKIEFLVDEAKYEPISNWVHEDKYIFVYGGDADIEWIKNFINLAANVAGAAKINLELIYAGKSCKKETVQTITEALKQDNLGNYLNDITFFWSRLDSMLHSKLNLGSLNDVTDTVAQEIKKIISYDQNPGTWVIICKGSKVSKSVAGTTMVEVLGKYEDWKGTVGPDKDFDVALVESIEAGKPESMCFSFEFPAGDSKIPETMKCPGCSEKMKNYVTFKCCHDDGVKRIGDGDKVMTRASPIAI